MFPVGINEDRMSLLLPVAERPVWDLDTYCCEKCQLVVCYLPVPLGEDHTS